MREAECLDPELDEFAEQLTDVVDGLSTLADGHSFMYGGQALKLATKDFAATEIGSEIAQTIGAVRDYDALCGTW